ncbi:hypothetical protein SAMN05661093_07239 [Kibdelosporangium aridum]|uniref:Uncharacterized protein n=1 Tax=Kibdelosporangium aridum TaxID=2030 RepID=A0A1W2FJB5_KIBAR|nr:hypothetical protein SAMN05661093_07239 [Kibdelosporangium aridum]
MPSGGAVRSPSSNARVGAGMVPIRALVDVGAPVGLGATFQSLQPTQDLWTAQVLVILLPKACRWCSIDWKPGAEPGVHLVGNSSVSDLVVLVVSVVPDRLVIGGAEGRAVVS